MEAIIFDVDGTLWDAKDEIVYSWNKALEGWPSVKKRRAEFSLRRRYKILRAHKFSSREAPRSRFDERAPLCKITAEAYKSGKAASLRLGFIKQLRADIFIVKAVEPF